MPWTPRKYEAVRISKYDPYYALLADIMKLARIDAKRTGKLGDDARAFLELVGFQPDGLTRSRRA